MSSLYLTKMENFGLCSEYNSLCLLLEMGKVGLGSLSWLECFPEAASDQEGLVKMV